MKAIARLLVRGGGRKDGIIIGVAMKGSRNVLKPATIYELREVLGEIVLVEAGPAYCDDKPRSPGYGVDLSRLVEEQHFYLTKEEHRRAVEDDREGRLTPAARKRWERK
jgi:hypothetical protein